MGHDVLTSHDAGNANRSVPDEEVLRFAASQRRILLTQNRLHFLRPHQKSFAVHDGIVICTYDPDFYSLAARVDEVVAGQDVLDGLLLRVYRPS